MTDEKDRRDWYDRLMRAGEAEYSAIIHALESLGLPTKFTQTGGMNAALIVQLETGESLLITDEEDSLAWRVDEKRGWGVGRYSEDEAAPEGPVAFASTADNSLDALLEVIGEVLLNRPTAR